MALLLAACGPAATPSPDAAPDTAAVDAATDTSMPDAAPDASAPDAAPDVSAPDVANDVARDASPDVSAPDAAPDVAIDATRDASPDVSAPDAAPDVATLDAARDAAPDAAPDAPRLDAATCTGTAPLCVAGMAGGQCGDTVSPATCAGTQWRCGAGEVFASQCACVGRPPGRDCTCAPTGWVCGDAGAPADAARDAAADGGGGLNSPCSATSECASGLLCCYPCGIPGCSNQCLQPMNGRCPLRP